MKNKARSELMRKKWQDPNFREMMLKSRRESPNKGGLKKGSMPWWVKKGVPHPMTRPEVSRKVAEKNKGRIPWNKGLTKDVDDRLKKVGEKIKRHWENPLFKETMRKKVSKSIKELHKNSKYRQKFLQGRSKLKGRTHSEEVRKKLSEIHKRKWEDPEYRRIQTEKNKRIGKKIAKKISKIMKELWKDPKYRIKQTSAIKRLWCNPEYRKKVIKRLKETYQNEELRKRQSEISSELWKKQYYREKVVKAVLQSLHKKPNKKEQKLNRTLQKILPNEYKFVGDGSFILGRRCPDFLNVNGKKKLIELFGIYWHSKEEEQERIDYFKQYGFDTLIIWENELENEDFLRNKIIKFNGE